MKNRFFSKYIVLPLLAGSCLLTGCRSTLYKAAQHGDIATVRQEIAAGRHHEDAYSGVHWLWQAPTCFTATAIDVSLLIGTAGLYALTLDQELGFPLQREALSCSMTPAEVAFDKGHKDITYELLQAGAPASTFVRNWMDCYYEPHKPAIILPPQPQITQPIRQKTTDNTTKKTEKKKKTNTGKPGNDTTKLPGAGSVIPGA